jgi:hypothetical protein
MVQRLAPTLVDLYEADETAWLDAMAELYAYERYEELDYAHLGEYLADTARSDRRQVENRFTTLLAHLLKWTFQPAKRSLGWRATIRARRLKSRRLLGGGVLRNHADAVLGEVYADAVELAMAETGLPRESFPPACPYSSQEAVEAELE